MTIYQNLIAGSGFLQGPTGATGPAANTNITIYEYVATAGQTTFTGVDSKLQTLAYTPTGIFVTLNGSVLNDVVDFTATNGTSVVLTQAAAVNDELNIYAFPAFSVAGTYTQTQTNTLLDAKLNLTGGTITGNLIASNISFANGSNLLVPVGNTAQRPAASPGYIRYNTDLNTLESANATAWANVGSGSASSGSGISWQPVQNTNFIAVAGNGYAVNTANANVVVTLPASPTIGSMITLVDYYRNFSSNNLIIYPNGNKIQGNTSNVIQTVNGSGVSLVYIDSTQGWISYSQGLAVGPYYVDVLTVAGGGGAGGAAANYVYGGGGGAGGLIYTASLTVNPGTSYSISIGAGGSGGTDYNTAGTNGGNSSFGAYSYAIGGGRGGSHNVSTTNGGSGGGGGNGGPGYPGGSGTSGQGNPGGAAVPYSPTGTSSGGGGGGAGATGTSGSSASGGPGGNGSVYTVSGTSATYAGGGGGAGNSSAGAGGSGGGGGSGTGNGNGSSASTNTGSGGGGAAGATGTYVGGAGGSGLVIVRYLGPQKGLGGTVTSSGGYTIHTFNSSGNFVA